MIVFNDIQSVSFASPAFEAFAEAYLCFLLSASAKKNKTKTKKLQGQLNS